ncbi:MAG: GDSL-type esterase/lipase family protein [Polyangiales bacterium]
MKRIAFVVAAGVVIAAGGLVTLKAWRYRKEAQLWHGRWLSLHSDPGGRDHYRADNERLRAQGVVRHRVVFLGASITEMLDLAGSFPDRNFVNRGAGGQLVWQQFLRLDDDALSLRPEAVVLKMCAINLLPDAPPLEEAQRYFAMMAERVRGRGVKAVLATAVPVSRRWDMAEADGRATPQIVRFNNWVRDQARLHHDLVLDYAQVLADDQGYLPDSLTDDGLHPNEVGRRRMLALIRTVLIEGRGQPQVEAPPAADGGVVEAPAPTPAGDAALPPGQEPKDR